MRQNKKANKKLKLENLFIARLGNKVEHGMKYRFEAISKPYVLVYKKNSEDYIDAINGTKYEEFGYWSDRFCVLVHSPLSQYLNGTKQKEEGYIDYEFALDLLESANDPEGYTKRKQQKDEDIIQKEKSKYGEFLPNNSFSKNIIVTRKEELSKLFLALASNYKNAIIVGEPGVGKTTLVNQLAYMIDKGSIPKFLRNKPIIEIKKEHLRKTHLKNKNIDSILKYAKITKAIILFDEVQNVFEENNSNYRQLFEKALEFNQVKVIATTTQIDYDRYFSKNDISTKFEKIELDEPDSKILQEIVLNTLNSYSKNLNISLPDEYIKKLISEILIEFTNKSNRIEWNNIMYEDYKSRLNNPHILIDIIDKSFAFARIEGNNSLEIDNIMQALKEENRFRTTAVEQALNRLQQISEAVDNNINIDTKVKIKK